MIRNADREDMKRIMEIYENARAFMAANGNAGQWSGGYPAEELLLEDLRKKQLYVYEEDQKIEAVFVYFFGEDPSYREIRNGSWLNEKPYGVLHRIAVAGQGRGIASICLQWCLRESGNLRGDTHENNRSMQRLFEKNGFTKCGIVTIEDGTDRIAYQKTAEER